MSNRTIRWGILGPGKIADKFASAFASTSEAKLVAVASRDEARGKAFAAKFGIPVIHTSYEALAADNGVDIIYVATPHSFHHEHSILCLSHKKSVLCEKPLTLSLAKAHEMIRSAEDNDVFLMEGMWSRFFPSINKALDLIASGVIGEVKFVRADFGFTYPFNAASRVYNPALGGGAQLDVGIYPMFLALLIFGKPERIQAVAQRSVTGVDETTSVQFSFKNGAMAHILSSFTFETQKQAEIMGTLGSITLHVPWYKSQHVTLRMNSGETSQFDFPFSGFGFEYQLQHVTGCMQQGIKESSLIPLDFSILMAGVADSILAQCDVKYPDNLS